MKKRKRNKIKKNKLNTKRGKEIKGKGEGGKKGLNCKKLKWDQKVTGFFFNNKKKMYVSVTEFDKKGRETR